MSWFHSDGCIKNISNGLREILVKHISCLIAYCIQGCVGCRTRTFFNLISVSLSLLVISASAFKKLHFKFSIFSHNLVMFVNYPFLRIYNLFSFWWFMSLSLSIHSLETPTPTPLPTLHHAHHFCPTTSFHHYFNLNPHYHHNLPQYHLPCIESPWGNLGPRQHHHPSLSTHLFPPVPQDRVKLHFNYSTQVRLNWTRFNGNKEAGFKLLNHPMIKYK